MKGRRTGLNWTPQVENAFNKIKAALQNAPALTLPDVSKPFHTYVDEKKGVSKVVVMQTLGP